jgi:UPF0755 protein
VINNAIDMRQQSRRRKSPVKGFIIFFLTIIAICGATAFVLWNNGTAAVNPTDKTERIFVIRQGTLPKQVGDELKQQGLINDPFVFSLVIKQLGIGDKIQAGSFKLSPAMDATTIAKTLTQASVDINATIPEGKRAEEIADILQEIMPNYTEAWRAELNSHEGYLFPDTYRFSRDASIDQIIATMTENFESKYTQVSNATTMSKEQIVILASMIEREAKHDEDRKLVSSVLHNRLDIGMALQIDATVQYALGYNQLEKTWWKKGLTTDDLEINSPYNTYTNTDLPPTPIANPGLATLQAAANPADTDYIFYISDKQGINHYAKTLSEHNVNIKKFGLQ